MEIPRPHGSSRCGVQARTPRSMDVSRICSGKGVLLDAVALHALALKLAGAAHGSGLFAGALFRRLLVVTAQLHFAIDTFPLQLLLERTKGLINIVVANHDLHKPKHLTKITNEARPASFPAWQTANLKAKNRAAPRKSPARLGGPLAKRPHKDKQKGLKPTAIRPYIHTI
ncbi:hypothetical protein PP1Y_AT18974 [Novosphingobium sp. PP1Y]|nr:hypothetical protein PP1Y_AT18974 [Novosphingobium sp. PP1Y]